MSRQRRAPEGSPGPPRAVAAAAAGALIAVTALVGVLVSVPVREAVPAARAVLAERPDLLQDYLELTDTDLGPAPTAGPARLLVAVRAGRAQAASARRRSNLRVMICWCPRRPARPRRHCPCASRSSA